MCVARMRRNSLVLNKPYHYPLECRLSIMSYIIMEEQNGMECWKRINMIKETCASSIKVIYSNTKVMSNNISVDI